MFHLIVFSRVSSIVLFICFIYSIVSSFVFIHLFLFICSFLLIHLFDYFIFIICSIELFYSFVNFLQTFDILVSCDSRIQPRVVLAPFLASRRIYNRASVILRCKCRTRARAGGFKVGRVNSRVRYAIAQIKRPRRCTGPFMATDSVRGLCKIVYF